jgi:hypothetical protein
MKTESYRNLLIDAYFGRLKVQKYVKYCRFVIDFKLKRINNFLFNFPVD